MPKGKQSYVPGLGEKSSWSAPAWCGKPARLAFSTQFSTQLVLGPQARLALNDRLTFCCGPSYCFQESFRKSFRNVGCARQETLAKTSWPGSPPEPRRMPPKRKETHPMSSPRRTKTPSDRQAPDPWVPNIGAVIPLCFNNLAWFTYGEDPLCRTSRTTTRNRSPGANQ